MDIETLQDMAAWARSRVVSGEEPPWTFQKLKHLNEICAELAAGMAATSASFPAQNTHQHNANQMANERGLAEPLGHDQPKEAQIIALDRFRSRRDERASLSLPT